jgi:hypothetical protein
MGVILFAGWYSPELCQQHPDKTFVFGDNTRRFGMGGQAIIRNQPNSYGISTKRYPSMSEASFFAEGNERDLQVVLGDIEGVWRLLEQGRTVVIPVTMDRKVSLGLERAELKQRAPSLYALIETHVKEMCDGYGEIFVAQLDDAA